MLGRHNGRILGKCKLRSHKNFLSIDFLLEYAKWPSKSSMGLWVPKLWTRTSATTALKGRTVSAYCFPESGHTSHLKDKQFLQPGKMLTVRLFSSNSELQSGTKRKSKRLITRGRWSYSRGFNVGLGAGTSGALVLCCILLRCCHREKVSRRKTVRDTVQDMKLYIVLVSKARLETCAKWLILDLQVMFPLYPLIQILICIFIRAILEIRRNKVTSCSYHWNHLLNSPP